MSKRLLVSIVALARKSCGRVDAFVCTLVHLHSGTLVDIAVRRLVTVVRAVRHLVAHQCSIYALAIRTPELTGARARGRVPTARTPEFVRIIAAIILVVATIRVPNALEILAREFTRRTRLVLRVTLLAFVRAIAAIVIVVANPSAIDTPPVAARELIRVTARCHGTVERRRVLVRPIHAVWVAIAQPLLRDALRPIPRFVGQTRELRRLVTLSVI